MEWAKVSPEAYKALSAVETYVRESGINKTLLELIKIRASQLNHCAYCIDMHIQDARKAGETEQRIYSLNAWQECPFYTDQERAVLALTEAITLLAESRVPDDVYNEAARHFNEKELVNIVMAINAINGWNRMGVTFRLFPEERK